MAQHQADKKPEATITGAKIALIGTIVAAIIGATATITVALLQPKAPAPTTVTAAAPRFVPRTVFDEFALEGDDGVKKILIDDYGMRVDEIRDVDCPADREVEAGTMFTCTVQVGGYDPGKREVDIIVRDTSGEYEVGRPRDR